MERVGRYKILGELGRGGCGIVYSALDEKIGRKVAIKTITTVESTASGTKANLEQRLLREAQSAGALSHPNIVTVYELAEEADFAYIVMEYIQGRTLAQCMASGEKLPAGTMLAILRQTAEALDFAHSQNIIHRDVKPANILISDKGAVKITDFGIAKILNQTMGLTQTGTPIGTAHYMAPEQITGKTVDGRTDQFAFAVIAYELVAGRRPFQGDSWMNLIHQVLNVDPPPVNVIGSGLGQAVNDVLQRALGKTPEGRYGTCGEFVVELERALGTATSSEMTATMVIPPGLLPGAKRRRDVKIGLIVGMLAALGVAGAVVYSWSRPDAPPSPVSSASPAPAPAVTPPQVVPPAATAAAPETRSKAEQVASSQVLSAKEPRVKASQKAAASAPLTARAVPQPTAPAAATPAPAEAPLPAPPPAPTGKYRGPPEGRFQWSGTLAPGATLGIVASRAGTGSLTGRGLPPWVAVAVEIEPAEVRVIEQPTAANQFRLMLRNASGREINSLTVRWKENSP